MIAFVDFQRGGTEQFAGVVRGADLLTAEAHDTGVTVHDLFPAQVFHLRRAELLDGLVVEINVTQLPDGFAFGLQREIDRREEQVEMFAVGEVGQERDHRADGQPESDALSHDQRVRIHS